MLEEDTDLCLFKSIDIFSYQNRRKKGKHVPEEFREETVSLTKVCNSKSDISSYCILVTGCKESQFYSLPFGQAVASLY